MSNLTIYMFKIFLKKKLLIKTNNLYNSPFPSFNLSMFTGEDCATINMEDRKEF